MYDRESYWIEQLQAWGHDLVNHQSGGKGWHGPRGPMSQEHKLKLSLAPRKPYKKHDAIARIANSRRNGGTKIVDQFGNIYQTQVEAAKAIGVRQSDICQHIHGKSLPIKGYVFKKLEG